MQPLARALLLAASICGAALAAQDARGSVASVSAVEKVIELLHDMESKAKGMKADEAVEFSKFTQFCTDTQANKAKEIEEANQRIESLGAEIEKLEADIRDLATKLDELNRGVATAEAELKEAKEQRQKDHKSYTTQISDFAESVDALERAIAVLQKQNYDRKQATEALLQLTTSNVLSEPVQRTVAAFVEMNTGDDFLTKEAPEANAYEFQSTSIVDLLKKLRDEFRDKQSEAEKEEMNSKHAYDMMSQDLNDEIEGATADISDKTVIKQEKMELAAKAKKELVTTTADRDDDVAYLKDLKVECSEKSKSFEEKQQLRAEEIEAIGKAIEIMSSPEVLAAAKEHLPAAAALAQKKAVALAQLRRSMSQQEPDTRRAAATFLEHAGRRLRSHQLSMIAERLATTQDPFVKVKKLISDLITQLLEEANQESEQKGFCDKELGTNEKTRTKLQDSIDQLTAKIDENEAAIAAATERLATLAAELVELRKAMSEATELRNGEQAKNEATVADAREAQKAITSAMAVLKDFYAKAGTATGFLQVAAEQTPERAFGIKEDVKMGSEEWKALGNPDLEGTVDTGHKEGMQTFGAVYRGMTDEAGGVMAMLEVISSDFATLQATTEAAESEAVRTYKDFMATSEKSVAVKEKETEMLTSDKAAAQEEVTVDKKDLAATQDQLLAAERYYEKLKPTCVNSGVTYDERRKAREEEIQSLQEALRILSGEDLAA